MTFKIAASVLVEDKPVVSQSLEFRCAEPRAMADAINEMGSSFVNSFWRTAASETADKEKNE